MDHPAIRRTSSERDRNLSEDSATCSEKFLDNARLIYTNMFRTKPKIAEDSPRRVRRYPES